MQRPALFIILILFLLTNMNFADTTYVSGSVFGTWDSDHSPYLVEAEIKIPTDSTLRIEHGCSIIFLGHYKFCVDSNAVIKALGTVTDSIIITALDTLLTDSSGGFHGIRMEYSAPGCSLVYCKLQYGNSWIEPDAPYYDRCGGAIFCDAGYLLIDNSTISNSRTESTGGGMMTQYTALVLTNSTISNNYAKYYGGGLQNGVGGYVAYNIFRDNYAGWKGGAIFIGGFGSTSVVNNIIRDNQCGNTGGGIYTTSTQSYVINNTIVNNYADSTGGGIEIRNRADLWIFNNIIRFNEAPVWGSDLAINYTGAWNDCSVYVAYNNIDTAGTFIEYMSGELFWGAGNIDSDPLFAGVYSHLGESSPCIDAGMTFYITFTGETLYAPPYDFEGETRPNGSGWDIGADEFYPENVQEYSPNLPADFTIEVYPNPFNTSCRISVASSGLRVTSLEILDINGRLVSLWVRGLVDSWVGGLERPGSPDNRITGSPLVRGMSEGQGDLLWQPAPATPSGIYLVRASLGENSVTKRVVYLK